MQKFEHLDAAFPSETASLSVVVKAKDVTAPAVQRGRRAARAGRRAAQPKLFPGTAPSSIDVNPDKTVATRRARHRRATAPTSCPTRRSTQLRDDLVPATLGKVAGRRDAYVDRRPGRAIATSTTR